MRRSWLDCAQDEGFDRAWRIPLLGRVIDLEAEELARSDVEREEMMSFDEGKHFPSSDLVLGAWIAPGEQPRAVNGTGCDVYWWLTTIGIDVNPQLAIPPVSLSVKCDSVQCEPLVVVTSRLPWGPFSTI
ncbi:hypothetical protein Taro_051459 [Colocasia esculenta]|uniref:Uncharacterized protein n=1 Tax=Colocasia esculenta TaxID=4460 RepID=A0A843XH97_COLES|nr:hypothetical protein [Colocasia esculenta]